VSFDLYVGPSSQLDTLLVLGCLSARFSAPNHIVIVCFVINYARCQLLSLSGFSSFARLYCGDTPCGSSRLGGCLDPRDFTNLKQLYACLVEHNDHGVPLGSMEIPKSHTSSRINRTALQQLLAHYPDMFTRNQLKAFDDLRCRRTWVADAGRDARKDNMMRGL
jgi:hypothetical protein